MAVVQKVLLFGSETWVLTPWLDKYLKVFHRWLARRMAVIDPKRQWYRMWVYPPLGSLLEMVGLEEIWVYIACC